MSSKRTAAFASRAFTAARRYGPKGVQFIDDAEKINKMYDSGDIPGLLRKFQVPEYIQRKKCNCWCLWAINYW